MLIRLTQESGNVLNLGLLHAMLSDSEEAIHTLPITGVDDVAF
jgi:hypothetical protein